jgi:membrane associated rhomboid family serine protease
MADEPRDDDYPGWIETVTSALGAIGFNKVRVRWKLRAWINRRRATRGHTTQAVKATARTGLRTPVGTTNLIALAIVVVFVRTAIATGKAAPMDISIDVLIRHGGQLFTFEAEWWRAATSMLLHGGLFHLGFNLLSLYVAGPILEEHYGKWMLPPIFIATGLAASFVSVAMHDTFAVGIGASGGLMGVIGCIAGIGQRIAMEGKRRGATIRNEMLLWSVFVMFFGFVVGADHWAHLGGFVAGGAIGLLLLPKQIYGTRLSFALGAAGVLALAATLWAAIVPLTSTPPALRMPETPHFDPPPADSLLWLESPTGDPGDLDDLGTKAIIERVVAAGDRHEVDAIWDPQSVNEIVAEMTELRAHCAEARADEACAELRRVDAELDAQLAQRR